jgi:hypothetical protein
MSANNRLKGNRPKKPKSQKRKNARRDSGIGQYIPYDKGRENMQGNPAGQGNEGDDVMPAGRETPG